MLEEEVGDEGGETEHLHSLTSDGGGWTGTNTGGNGNCGGGGGLMDFHDHDVPSHGHTMAPDSNLPRHVVLAYVIYLGVFD